MNNIRPIKARISAAADTTRVDVYDDIGDGGWFSEGLTAKSFAGQLAAVTGALEVHVNSGGGDVWDGLAIASALRAHPGQVTVVVDGIAASIASVIAQAGAERVMMPGAMMMIHDAFTSCVGDAAEMAKTAQTLDEVSNNLAAQYAAAAGGTAEQWRAAMRDTTWYTAEQAVDAGLADRIGDGSAVLPAGADLEQFAAGLPAQIAAQLRAMPRAEAQSTVLADVKLTDAQVAEFGALLKAAQRRRAVVVSPRVLGAETMPIVDKALPVHHTATVDTAWDGPAAVAAMPADDQVLAYCHAWESDQAAATPHKEGDDDADDRKGNYKFPHHTEKGGPANLAACRNGLARLEGADIPDGDRAGVTAHLQAHLDDAAHDHGDGTHDHAGPPAWLNNDPTPIPAWFTTPAKEATQ